MADYEITATVSADTAEFEDGLQRASQAAQQAKLAIEGTGNGAAKASAVGKDAIAAWTRAFAPLQSAFTSSITGMIMGTTSWQQAVQRVTQNLLAEEVGFAVKRVALWAAQETGITQMLAQQNQIRGASDATSQSSLLTLLAQGLARWLGFETAKTAATQQGNATRTASDTATQAASSAFLIARALGQIQVDAAVAAAGAMAATEAIPIVGPELAPLAAAAAYAQTMGWAAGLGAGLISAAGGLWNVPSDTLALVHQQETIIPASIAAPMRDFFTGGAQAGGGSYAITVQAIDTQTGAQFLMNNAATIAKSLAREMRNGNALLRSGG